MISKINLILIFFYVFNLNAQNKHQFYLHVDFGLSLQKNKFNQQQSAPSSNLTSSFPEFQYSDPIPYFKFNLGAEKKINRHLNLSAVFGFGNLGYKFKIDVLNAPENIIAIYNRHQVNFSLYLKSYLFSFEKEETKRRKKKKSISFFNIGIENSYMLNETYTFNGVDELFRLRDRNKYLFGYIIGFGLENKRVEYRMQITSYLSNILINTGGSKTKNLVYYLGISYRLNKN